MVWNPEQYLRFAQPRLRPAVDLLARVDQRNPKNVYDLGCGAGNVTRLLAERWPQSSIVGIDDSAEMLAQAAKELPKLQWINRSIAEFAPDRPVDLLFSNAALHWLPRRAPSMTPRARAISRGRISGRACRWQRRGSGRRNLSSRR